MPRCSEPVWPSQHFNTALLNVQTVSVLNVSFPSQPVRPILRRPRLAGVQSNVRFDQVTVFSFPRCQGFTSVPSHGGATLGMTRKHSALQRYSLAEHALEQRRRRREKLRERRREEKLEALKLKVCSCPYRLAAAPLLSTSLTVSVARIFSGSPVGSSTSGKRKG